MNREMTAESGNTLEKAIAHYGFAMSRLVEEKIRETGREDEIRSLLARGFRFLFTFAPLDGSNGCQGEVGAALIDTQTRQAVHIFNFDLVEVETVNAAGSRLQ